MNVKIWDNGGRTFDRYTVIFPDGDALGIGATGNVPNGFCQSIGRDEYVEGPHLGQLVALSETPKAIQRAITAEWNAYYSKTVI